MNCPNCNSQIPPYVNHCPNCRTAIRQPQQQFQQPGYQQQFQQQQQFRQPGYQQQFQQPGYQQPGYQQQFQQPGYQQGGYMMPPKSRITYILLGLFLGGFGVHNFYAGYTGRAVTQLVLNLLLCWTFVVPIAIGIWILIEVCTVNKDATGNMMV